MSENRDLPIENQPFPEENEQSSAPVSLEDTTVSVEHDPEIETSSRQDDRPSSEEIDVEFNTNKNPSRKSYYEKNVSIKQCIITIIASLIALLVIFIPVDLVNGTSAISVLPIFGDGSFLETQTTIALGLKGLAGFGEEICATFGSIFNFSTYAYLGILLADIVFAIFLIITKSVVARRIFKVFSILFGIAMILISICQILYIGAFAGLSLFEITAETPPLPSDHGLILCIAMLFVSIVMVKRQFNWFARWY